VTPRAWPPQCCVPAFVHAALVKFGVDCAYPETIPGMLDVRVLPDQKNPLRLRLADATHPPGISGADAEREVNRMCADLKLPVRLRRVPFNTIQAELWEDVLDAALASGAVAGIGVEYNLLMGTTMSKRSAQHVLRVLHRDARSLRLFDDSGESEPAAITVDLERVRSSVLPIGDGLWIMNDKSRLNMPYTLTWGTDA
jgi:hypothetical protein